MLGLIFSDFAHTTLPLQLYAEPDVTETKTQEQHEGRQKGGDAMEELKHGLRGASVCGFHATGRGSSGPVLPPLSASSRRGRRPSVAFTCGGYYERWTHKRPGQQDPLRWGA